MSIALDDIKRLREQLTSKQSDANLGMSMTTISMFTEKWGALLDLAEKALKGHLEINSDGTLYERCSHSET